MSQDSDLRKLYLALEAVRPDPQVASVIGELISVLGSTLHPLGKEQIGEFTIGDLVYRADLSDRFGRACIYGGRQERDDLDLFLGLCDSGSVIWDIGANFGLYTVAAADKAGPTGVVFAVEPSPRAMALLKDNTQNNAGGASVRLFSCAIADFDGTATFHDAQETAFSGLSNTGRSPIATAVPVEVRRLDSLWQDTGRQPVDLIKIDVEGHEADVMLGGREAIAASPQAVIQFETSPKNLDELRREKLLATMRGLQAEGMALWCLDSSDRSLIRLPMIGGELPKKATGNLFMVRQGSDREARLIGLADQLSKRPPLVSSELEKAMLSTLRQISVSAKGKLLEQLAKKNSAQATLKQPIHSPPALGVRSRPFALASVESVTAVIRVTAQGQDVAAAVQSAIAFSAGRPCSLIIVDGRAKGGPIECSADATLISPAAHMPHRYGRSTLAALRVAETSHVLLMDADGTLEGSLDQVAERWREKASKNERVAGLAFAFVNEDAGTQIMQEETVGGMLALRYGLLAIDPLRELVHIPDSFAGDGFDLDLSLSLWHRGFMLTEAPASVYFHARRKGPRPTHNDADQMRLEERWSGIYFHPSMPALFRTGRLRSPRQD
jgi:FkbM family methyltransferase